MIVPPAACTAATAAAEAPETVMVIARVISPFASSRTPANFAPGAHDAGLAQLRLVHRLRRRRSRPLSIAFSSATRLSGA